MCGIFGCWNVKSDIKGIKKLLEHRGPDESGIHEDGKRTLLNTRLSIIDIDHGKQPIANENKKMFIVYNGELYNFKSLRKLLRDHKLSTNTDTEVLLHLFEKFGKKSLRFLDGMFSFAIYDGKSFFLARDHVGIKPLYYVIRKDKFAFASEKKALIFSGFHDYEINALPPGHYAIFNGEKLTISRYHKFSTPSNSITNLQFASKMLRRLIYRSVEKMQVSDVPIGTFLSGGIDSTIITEISRSFNPDIKSFTVGMKSAEDLNFASMYAEQAGINLKKEIFSESDIIKILPKIIWFLEDCTPIAVRNSVPTYFVSKLASRHIRVVLCGEGSDELYGGYKFFNDAKDVNTALAKSFLDLEIHNLNRVDKMSMANSLEARVPFLGKSVIEFSQNISSNLKIHNGVEKFVLRKSFENILPDFITKRQKTEMQRGTGVRELLKYGTQNSGTSEKDFYKVLYAMIFKREDFGWNNKLASDLTSFVKEKFGV